MVKSYSPIPFLQLIHMLEAPPPQGTRLELTVLIVAILKEAMLTYPGNIDFETGVSNAFTPLKYAIDRGIYEQFMLQPLEEPWPSSC